MEKSIFIVSKMDCPSEENLIRMKIGGVDCVKSLDFDFQNRKLTIIHEGKIEEIEVLISELNLDANKLTTESVDSVAFEDQGNQKRLLWIVLIMNISFFIIEMMTGLVSFSMGLIADSLDMLADSFVYGLSLFAVGGTAVLKKRIAVLAGYSQILLASVGLIEVFRRFLGVERVPDFSTMITISICALMANGFCLYILQRSKSKEIHMQASMIFTSNDVIINFGVIIAGVLVNWMNSNMPDLIIGMIVFVLVVRGAFRILSLAK